MLSKITKLRFYFCFSKKLNIVEALDLYACNNKIINLTQLNTIHPSRDGIEISRFFQPAST